MALQAGQLFGNYRIVRLIGEGGFGEVYLAENPLIERRVAVKVLHAALAQDGELVRRFLNEARAASAIRHPNIIEVFDAGGSPDGSPYILMEFLDGVSLQKRLVDAGRLVLAQVLDIATQAGSALAAAHAVGIVHRDLKPENLFLVPDAGAPGGERVKVLDFGIAKIKHSGQAGGTVRTQTGFIMGSPAYMSPEQCKDSADVDLRADIYSFATILYEMLAGRTPYVGATGTELLIMHLTETPQPLLGLAPDVPAHVASAIMRALSRAREDRFESVADFLGALRGVAVEDTAILGQPSSALPPTHAAIPHTDRIIAVQPNTTFSRSSGEVDVAGSDDALVATTRSRRWMPIAIGGVAVAGLALFLLVRPGQNSAPTTATSASSAAALPAEDTVAPAKREQPGNVGVATLPNKADAGAEPVAVAKSAPAANSENTATAETPPNRHRAIARTPTAVPQRAATGASPRPGNPTPAARQNPEDVTGF
jgi:serine/threonine protein kinase